MAPAPIMSLFRTSAGVLHFGDKLASTSLSNHNMKTLSLFGRFARHSGEDFFKSTAHLHKINNHTSK